jgi:hypothetical protein
VNKMFSPFDLRGPEFLLFYLLFGACVLAALFLLRYTGEATDPPQLNLSDPYLIAFLRGGRNETLRVATVSLIDRGFLQVAGNKVSAVQNISPSQRKPLPSSRRVNSISTPTAMKANSRGWTSFPGRKRRLLDGRNWRWRSWRCGEWRSSSCSWPLLEGAPTSAF